MVRIVVFTEDCVTVTSLLTSHSVLRNFSDYESKHSPQAIGVDSPVRTRRHSWRQQIFLRVATPQKACDSPSRYDGKVCVLFAPINVVSGCNLKHGSFCLPSGHVCLIICLYHLCSFPPTFWSCQAHQLLIFYFSASSVT